MLVVTILVVIDLVQRGARASVIGVNRNVEFRFPMAATLNKRLVEQEASRLNRLCGPPQFWPEPAPFLQHGRLRSGRVFGYAMLLAEGVHGYDIFDRKVDGTLKIMSETWHGRLRASAAPTRRCAGMSSRRCPARRPSTRAIGRR